MIKLFALPMIFVLFATSFTGCLQKYTKDQAEPDIQITTGDTTEDETDDPDEVSENGTVTGDDIPQITEEELEREFYYGDKDQKKPGTPDDWIFIEAGRSSMWKKP